MITIDKYTGKWQAALQPPPRAPRVGSHVRISWEPDAREIDDFKRVLREAGLRLGALMKNNRRVCSDTYEIVRRKDNDID